TRAHTAMMVSALAATKDNTALTSSLLSRYKPATSRSICTAMMWCLGDNQMCIAVVGGDKIHTVHPSPSYSRFRWCTASIAAQRLARQPRRSHRSRQLRDESRLQKSCDHARRERRRLHALVGRQQRVSLSYRGRKLLCWLIFWPYLLYQEICW